MPDAIWRTTPVSLSDATDIECPRHDEFPHDAGCQIRCRDDNCTTGWRALLDLREKATHLSINCCPPYQGCSATVKGGVDPLAGLAGDMCERRCAAKLSHAYYNLELTKRTPLCVGKRRPGSSLVPKIMGGSRLPSSGGGSTLSLVGNYMHATNVAIDFSKSGCPTGRSRERNFRPGFLVADCEIRAPARGAASRRNLRKVARQHGIKRGKADGATDGGASGGGSATAIAVPAYLDFLQPIVASAESGPLPACEYESRFTVFLSRKARATTHQPSISISFPPLCTTTRHPPPPRLGQLGPACASLRTLRIVLPHAHLTQPHSQDMGNYAHHLGDMLAVFQLFDFLQLTPAAAQLVLLDVRLMCWGDNCVPDCYGPFSRLWPAITGGARVLRAADYVENRSRPVCFQVRSNGRNGRRLLAGWSCAHVMLVAVAGNSGGCSVVVAVRSWSGLPIPLHCNDSCHRCRSRQRATTSRRRQRSHLIGRRSRRWHGRTRGRSAPAALYSAPFACA